MSVPTLEGARRAEAYSFDSVWVRDHLVFQTARREGGDPSHLECLMLLAALARATSSLQFGTAMAICHRHPIHLGNLRRIKRNLQWALILGLG